MTILPSSTSGTCPITPRPRLCCHSRHASNSPLMPSPANPSRPWPISTKSAASSSTSNSATPTTPSTKPSLHQRPNRRSSSSGCPSPNPGCGHWSSASPSSATSSLRGVHELLADLFDYPFVAGVDPQHPAPGRRQRTPSNNAQQRPRRGAHRRPRRDLPGQPTGSRRRRRRFDLLLPPQSSWKNTATATPGACVCWNYRRRRRGPPSRRHHRRFRWGPAGRPSRGLARRPLSWGCLPRLARPATTPLVRYLENRAYDAIATRSRLEGRQARTEHRHGRKDASSSRSTTLRAGGPKRRR